MKWPPTRPNRRPSISPDLARLIRTSVLTLRAFAPSPALYYGCFSGGKDSVALKHLTSSHDIPVEWHTQITGLEPPELTAFIRRFHKHVTAHHPKRSFHQLIHTKGLPTSKLRWCCHLLKETQTPPNRTLLMGLRASESFRRASTWHIATPLRPPRYGHVISPLLHWKERDVWTYIDANRLPYCSLYDEGRKRIGCVMCPMNKRQRLADIQRWPAMATSIKRHARDWWTGRKEAGSQSRTYTAFDTFDDFWNWWLSDRSLPAEH